MIEGECARQGSGGGSGSGRHSNGPPECVSACDGDICCDAGICSDCSTSSCSQEDMAMIEGECARQGSGGGSGRHSDGPPECVSACDGDICCDAGICSDCSTSSCSQDDMTMIVGECARQNAQGSGGGSGSGSGG